MRIARQTSSVSVAIVLFAASGCGGKSINDLAAARYKGAGSCSKQGVAEIAGAPRSIYSCQDGKGGTICVTRDGDDLYAVSADQLEALGMSC